MHNLIPLEVTNESVTISIEKLIINELSLKVYSTPSNYEEIRNNIDKTGIIQPILINRNYKVISGNLRLKIARDLNYEVVTVLVQDISDDEIDSLFLSSNFQREKSLLDKYRENELINSLFGGVRQGVRTDLDPQLKEDKEKKDNLKKGLTHYEREKLARLNKMAKEKVGNKYKDAVIKELKKADKEGWSLNKVVSQYTKLKKKRPITRVSKPTKAQIEKEIKKLLIKLPPNERTEVLVSINDYYSLKKVS